MIIKWGNLVNINLNDFEYHLIKTILNYMLSINNFGVTYF